MEVNKMEKLLKFLSVAEPATLIFLFLALGLSLTSLGALASTFFMPSPIEECVMLCGTNGVSHFEIADYNRPQCTCRE
ncbi:MAG: hypothetical protein WC761_01135 [Candidatus Paceibacterota bacterium]|jgi:hypothetical protein